MPAHRRGAGEIVVMEQIRFQLGVRIVQIPGDQFVDAAAAEVFGLQVRTRVHRLQMLAFEEVVEAAECAARSADAVVHRVVGVGLGRAGFGQRLDATLGVPRQRLRADAGLRGEPSLEVVREGGFDAEL